MTVSNSESRMVSNSESRMVSKLGYIEAHNKGGTVPLLARLTVPPPLKEKRRPLNRARHFP